MIKGIRHLLQSKQFHDFFLYVVVGGLATIVEWVAFWVLENPMHIQYLVSTAMAFVFPHSLIGFWEGFWFLIRPQMSCSNS